jgi:hypothetical protein
VEELGIPELTTKQIELLCKAAENAAKKYVLSKVSLKLIEKLNIIVEAVGEKPITIKVEVDLELSSTEKYLNTEKIAKVAVQAALNSSESYLRKLQ